jgi:hypothetical protein
MLRADRHVAEPQSPQHLANCAFVHRHAEPLVDPFAQIKSAPADHSILRRVGTLLDPCLELGLLRRVEQRRTT